MEINSLIIFSICIIGIIFVGKFFSIPIKKIVKLIGNSILGSFFICIINLIGEGFDFHVGLNIITSIFVGIFGVPGAILLIIFKFMI